MLTRLLFLFVLLANIGLAQENPQIDERLLTAYDSEYLHKLANENPQLLDYYTFKLDHSYYIMDLDVDTDKEYPLLYKMDYSSKSKESTPVENVDVDTFNILEYATENKPERRTVYRIGDSGLALVIYSEKEIAEEFNKTYTGN